MKLMLIRDKMFTDFINGISNKFTRSIFKADEQTEAIIEPIRPAK